MDAKLVYEVLSHYDLPATLVGFVPYGYGHINDTYCVLTQPKDGDCIRFILQRINPNVFPDAKALMENIVGVTSFLRKSIIARGGDPEREAIQILPTKEGTSYYTDDNGNGWRLMPFVEGTVCLQAAETPELFEASGKAFGRFQQMLGDYPSNTLQETLPGFHDTEKRLERFLTVLKADPMGRAKEVQPEIDFLLAREKDCSVALDAHRQGILPLRVTHNDTKLNNVLLDRNTLEGICVIDLDTVMPGLSMNDFGDSIRFGANHSAEDEKDLSKVNFDLSLFKVYTRGFLEGAAGTLTEAEIRYLPWGARLMTLECGIRFLTDYLEGDVYFRTEYPGQNLDRCRTQFKLVADMESVFPQMEAICEAYVK